MLTPLEILRLEGRLFPALLGGTVAYRLLVRRIHLNGLLTRKRGRGVVSPERVQLLIATLAVAGRYLSDVLHSTSGTLPDVGTGWLYLFGSSGGIYASVKAITTFGPVSKADDKWRS